MTMVGEGGGGGRGVFRRVCKRRGLYRSGEAYSCSL